MVMTGGTISGNVSEAHGGGICVAATFQEGSDNASSLTMTGGTVASNTSRSVWSGEEHADDPFAPGGGGIYLHGGTKLSLGGSASVSGNAVEGHGSGGGVYLQCGEDDVPASTFEMTGGALYFNVAGEDGNVSAGAADAGAEVYVEGGTTSLTLPAAEEITVYVQAPGSPYVPEDDRSAWFTSWYDDYSDQDAEFGKGDAATRATGRHTGRYLSSTTIDRMAYEPAESDVGRRALILDRSTSLALEKRVAGDDAPSDETYEFEVRVENLPDVEVAGTRYPLDR